MRKSTKTLRKTIATALLAAPLAAQSLNQGTIAITGQDRKDYGIRTNAVVDLGPTVATHFFESLPGVDWGKSYGKIASLRKKGAIQPGVAVFKSPTEYIAAVDVTHPYKFGPVKGFVSAMLPFDSLNKEGSGGSPFFLLEGVYQKGDFESRTFANVNSKKGPMFFQQGFKYRLQEGKHGSLYGTAQVSVPRIGHTRGNIGIEYRMKK